MQSLLAILAVLQTFEVHCYSCKSWCGTHTSLWEDKCFWDDCRVCHQCLWSHDNQGKTVRCQAEGEHGIFRIAVFDVMCSESTRLNQGLVQFAAEEIQSKEHGCISVGGKRYHLEFICYQHSALHTASNVKHSVWNAAQGNTARGVPLGEVDLLIAAGGSSLTLWVSEGAEEVQMPNIHTNSGDPRWWSSSRRFAFGIALPYTEYFNAPLRAGSLRGYSRIAIITAHKTLSGGLSIDLIINAASLAAVPLARQYEYTIVGPTASWCLQYGNYTKTCRMLEGHCRCGAPSGLKPLGLQWNVAETPTFYEIDMEHFGKTKDRTISPRLEWFFTGIIEDIRSQGVDPDVLLALVRSKERWSLLYSLWRQAMSPKMLAFPDDFTTRANKTKWGHVLNMTHGGGILHAEQWDATMNAADPVFGNSSNAAKKFKERFERNMDAQDAAIVATGSIIKVALEKYSSSFEGLTLLERWEAIRHSLSRIYDDTLFGVVRFGRRNQNNGREPVVTQRFLDGNTSSSSTVLPERYADVNWQPFQTWSSRFGCSKGMRNTGSDCEACALGTYSPNSTAGMVRTYCSTCPVGMEPIKTDSILSEGSNACDWCPAGRYRHLGSTEQRHGSIVPHGRCAECNAGSFRNSSMDPSRCSFCAAGQFTGSSGSASCSDCPAGRYRDSGDRSDACNYCPVGKYQPSMGAVDCLRCYNGAVCPNNGTAYPKPGYYRFDKPELFLKFFLCPTPGACLGGMTSSCRQGMHGPLCNSCIRGWTRPMARTRCRECLPQKVQRVIFLAVVLAFVAYISIMVRITISGIEKKSVIAVASKIFLNYLQMASISIRMADFDLGMTLANLVAFLSGAAGDPTSIFFSLDCENFGFDDDTSYEMRLAVIGIFLIPTALAAVVFIQFVFRICWWMCCCSCSHLHIPASQFSSMIIISCFVLHPMITDMFVKSIDCVKYDTWRLRVNTLVECGSFDQTQAQTVALFGIMIWSLGLPILALALLYMKRQKLYSRKVRKMYGYLYQGFKHRFCYFECVFMLRKVLVVIAATVPVKHRAMNTMFLLIVGILSLGIQSRCMPYDNRGYDMLDRLELYSIWSFLATLIVSLTFHWTTKESKFEKWLRTPFHYVVILFHANFWMAMIQICFRPWWLHVRKKISRWFHWLMVGEMLIDRNGAIDLSGLSHGERRFLKTALGELLTCALDNTRIFRAQQFNQLVLIAAARVLQHRDKRKTTQRLSRISRPSSRASERSSGAGSRFAETLRDVRFSIMTALSLDREPNGHRILVLSEAATEASKICEKRKEELNNVSVEELHAALVNVSDLVYAGELTIEPNIDLENWSAALSGLVNRAESLDSNGSNRCIVRPVASAPAMLGSKLRGDGEGSSVGRNSNYEGSSTSVGKTSVKDTSCEFVASDIDKGEVEQLAPDEDLLLLAEDTGIPGERIDMLLAAEDTGIPEERNEVLQDLRAQTLEQYELGRSSWSAGGVEMGPFDNDEVSTNAQVDFPQGAPEKEVLASTVREQIHQEGESHYIHDPNEDFDVLPDDVESFNAVAPEEHKGIDDSDVLLVIEGPSPTTDVSGASPHKFGL